RLAAPIPRRHGKLQHLVDRPAVDAEKPCGLPPAQSVDENGTPHPRIKLHTLHPRPRPKARRLPLAEFCSGQRPDYPAASVVDFCTGALKFSTWIRTRDAGFLARHSIPEGEHLQTVLMLPKFVTEREKLIRQRLRR